MRKYLQADPLNFTFKQTKEDFFVEEIPQFKGSDKGRFLVVAIQKQNLTTWEMLERFANFLCIKPQEIGYAGLKDKHATTIQYVTISKKYAKALQNFSHPKIKIFDTYYASSKLSIGDLKGNRFRINLYDVDRITAGKIEKRARKLLKNGVPNYFGYQRFGRGEAWKKAKAFVQGDLYIKDKKLQRFYISIYQSKLFNDWLVKRVELGLTPLTGDIFQNGIFTGLLAGRHVARARGDARKIEKLFDDDFVMTRGDRRAALFFPKDLEFYYDMEKGRFTLSFVLSKGSYATVFLEAIKAEEIGREIFSIHDTLIKK